MTRPVWLGASLALAVLAGLPRAPVLATPGGPGGYKVDPGPFRAASENVVLHDEARRRGLEITVRYPQVAPSDPARFPIVIFSHGAGGSRSAFTALTSHWATHGYIVILPTHADSIELRRRQGEDLSRLRRDLDGLRRDVRPMDRLADVTFLLDSLGTIEERIPGLKSGAGQGRMDRDRIGMAGHSAGALTTQMAFGVKVRGLGAGLGLQPQSVGDPRIDAAILISGQGTTNRMLTAGSWAELDKPMLVITGSRDVATIGNETPASRREPFERAKPGDKYLVFIEGATHSSYQGRDRALALDPSRPSDDELTMITGVTTASTLAFLDVYLKDDKSARAYLHSDALVAFSGRKAALERK
ncbi:MAG: hypothetical protein AB1806_19855 [Acidobacteriota bacterium]